ncbi:MAG: peptidoglycan-binding protein [Proteobacteria bacterium]|nr:peptidoglycan-binding protein [Pseudomonadota bacterium]
MITDSDLNEGHGTTVNEAADGDEDGDLKKRFSGLYNQQGRMEREEKGKEDPKTKKEEKEDDGDEGKTIGHVDHAKITVGEEVRLAQGRRDPAGPPWKPDRDPIAMPGPDEPPGLPESIFIDSPDLSELCTSFYWIPVKRVLQAHGYSPGIVEQESFDQPAIEALKIFQADNNLKPDGRITDATLRALGIF